MIATSIPNNVLWHKSSRSAGQTNCVEIAATGSIIGIRDSKNLNSPILLFSHHQWQNFIQVMH
jgi:Domain of unknown function (DUF397)